MTFIRCLGWQYSREGGNMLFNELKLRSGEVIKNRFLKAAISEGLSKDRNPSEEMVNLYKKWSQQEIGILISGNVMIDKNAVSDPANIILDNDSDRASFKEWNKAKGVDGTVLWLQLNHPGNQAPRFVNSYSLTPSAIPFLGSLQKLFAKPREMKEEDILNTISKFGNAGRLAKEFGFSGVQIQAAHGYLISQFLSKRYNKRKDMWGGCLENRARFLLEVYKAIRKEGGNSFSISVKINSEDFVEDGFKEEESLQVIKWLDELGIDLVEISGGNFEKAVFAQEVKDEEGFFRAFSQKVKKIMDVPVALTGGIRSANFMEELLQDGITDVIGLGRPFISEPALVKKIKSDKQFYIMKESGKPEERTQDSSAFSSFAWYKEQINNISKA